MAIEREHHITPDDQKATASAASRRLRRWLPLAALVAIMALAYGMGWHKHLSFQTIGTHYDALRGFIDAHLAAAVAIYLALYVTVVTLSLPAAGVLTITGGLLFGWQIGAPVTIVGATLGATLIFLIARSSLGEALAEQAGPWLGKLREGFRDNALSYLLFLRLVPAFPFAIVNLAAAVLGVPLKTYVIGTALGIIPGTAAFSFAGAGLGSVVEAQNAAFKTCVARHPADAPSACTFSIDTGSILTKELVIALALLGAVALIPVAIKTWKARHADV